MSPVDPFQHVAELRSRDRDDAICRRWPDDMAFSRRAIAPWTRPGVGPADREDIAMEEVRAFVGLDVHKATISIAVADDGRGGEVRHVGTIENTPVAIGKLARKLARRHGTIEFVYEAGSCGYNVQRQLAEMGMACRVCAPSLTPRKPGERVKNDRRDAIALARLHRAGELTYVWVPDELHEALRDLVRARHAACEDVRRDRIRLQAFLLRYDLRFEGKPWSTRHRKWLWNRQFAHPAQQIAFQAHLNALDHDEARKRELEEQIWTYPGFVESCELGMRVAVGVSSCPPVSWHSLVRPLGEPFFRPDPHIVRPSRAATVKDGPFWGRPEGVSLTVVSTTAGWSASGATFRP
jgi:transposase